MRCGFDIGCHVLNWFWSLPWWVHWGLVALAVLALWGVLARVWSFAKGLGGWQAAVAAVGALGLILAAVWPKAARKVATEELFPHPDGEKPRPRAKAKKRKPDPMREDWLRRPNETAAEWQERVSKTR
jgi:hypothetical protein